MTTLSMIVVEVPVGSEDSRQPTLIQESLQAVYDAGGFDATFHVLIGGPANRISDYLHKRVPATPTSGDMDDAARLAHVADEITKLLAANGLRADDYVINLHFALTTAVDGAPIDFGPDRHWSLHLAPDTARPEDHTAKVSIQRRERVKDPQ